MYGVNTKKSRQNFIFAINFISHLFKQMLHLSFGNFINFELELDFLQRFHCQLNVISQTIFVEMSTLFILFSKMPNQRYSPFASEKKKTVSLNYSRSAFYDCSG